MGRTIAITAATVLFGFAVAVSPVHANEDTDDSGSKSCPKGAGTAAAKAVALRPVAELARPGIAPQMLALMDDQRL